MDDLCQSCMCGKMRERTGLEYQRRTRTGSKAGGCFRRNPRSFEKFIEFIIVSGFHNDTS